MQINKKNLIPLCVIIGLCLVLIYQKISFDNKIDSMNMRISQMSEGLKLSSAAIEQLPLMMAQQKNNEAPSFGTEIADPDLNSLERKVSGRGTFGKPFIFAVASKKCPYGSIIYDGPEQKKAIEDGFIYCNFFRSTVTMKRSEGPCPEKYVEFKQGGLAGKGDVLFCQRQ